MGFDRQNTILHHVLNVFTKRASFLLSSSFNRILNAFFADAGIRRSLFRNLKGSHRVGFHLLHVFFL